MLRVGPKLILVSLLLLACCLSSLAQNSTVTTIENTIRSAFRSPRDPHRFAQFKAVLPQAADFYVVEGDILKTESELREYLDEKASKSGKGTKRSGELLVNSINGNIDYYKDFGQRTLTYSVDKSSFPRADLYQAVVATFRRAASDWEAACQDCSIHFVYKSDLDNSASPNTTNFVVRYLDVHGAYVAASFFPHDAPLRRYLNLDPSYFGGGGFDKVGVLRHEIGHILGYRHEHIQGIPGCAREGNDWVPLTGYDRRSVMHYFCGGGGSPALEITDLDKDGHHKLYGPTQTSSLDLTSAERLVVRFKGGEVADNAAKVLAILYKERLVKTTTYPVQPGENVSAIYQRKLNLPGAPRGLVALAELINSQPPEKVGQSDLLVPDVTLSTYEFHRKLDQNVPEERYLTKLYTANWRYILRRTLLTKKPSELELRFTGYQLDITSDNIDAIKRAAMEIRKSTNNQNVSIVCPSCTAIGEIQYFSHVSPNTFINEYRSHRLSSEDEEGDLAEMLRVAENCSNEPRDFYPEVVLLDKQVFPHREFHEHVKHTPYSGTGELSANAVENFTIRDHGTHLAGIISSQQDHFGVIGIDPRSTIDPWNWDELSSRRDELSDLIRDRADSAPFPIFLFASGWDRGLADNGSEIAGSITGSKVLWISAAGDSKDGDGEDISENFRLGPMNLGRDTNIIIVTACEDCYSGSPRLMHGANFSTSGLVPIAAPGLNIPSTVSNNSYDVASGTSQAAALVAGLVSRMVGCWPEVFQNSPGKIKSRLELTARPELKGDDARRVDAGIVDGKAALLNPRLSWNLVAVPQGDEYTEVSPRFWCSVDVDLRDENGQRLPLIRTQDVRRIVKQDQGWVIFTRERDGIRRQPTGYPANRNPNSPLLKVSTGTSDGVLRFNDIRDLILDKGLPNVSCAQ